MNILSVSYTHLDVYKRQLGESALCETCDEFPRFKNEYGATREIGVAPSCPVVAEMFMSLDEAKLVSETNDELVTTYNDIDASFYFELIQLRKDIFKIIFDKSLGTMSERLEPVSYTHLDVYKRQGKIVKWSWIFIAIFFALGILLNFNIL